MPIVVKKSKNPESELMRVDSYLAKFVVWQNANTSVVATVVSAKLYKGAAQLSILNLEKDVRNISVLSAKILAFPEQSVSYVGSICKP